MSCLCVFAQDEIPPGHSQLVVVAVATQASYSYSSQQQLSVKGDSNGIGHSPSIRESIHQVAFS